MSTVRVTALPGMDDAPAAEWAGAFGGAVDRGAAYLRFREEVEPGDPVLVVARDAAGGLLAAAHGAVSVPASALFSAPWAMLTADQFLRAEDPAELRAARDRILAGVRLGPASVVRGFDESRVLTRPDGAAAAAEAGVDAVVGGLQEPGRPVVFPFADPADELLAGVLARRGFRRGTLTAASTIPVPAAAGYDELLAGLRRSVRRRARKEERLLAAAGLRLSEIPLGPHVETVVDLEVQTARRHGGQPRPERLLAARRRMAELLAGSVRVPVALDPAGQVVACGVDLVDAGSYYGLVYGCDYSADRATAYLCLAFYDPLRYAVEHGIGRIRLGFEAFEPKLLRGAEVVPRHTWVWLPDPAALAAVGDVLDLLTERFAGYQAELPRLAS